jgi:hypothetical protein
VCFRWLEQEEEIKQARIAIAANKKAAEARSRRDAVASGTPNLPPKVGEFVWSSFGPGVVEEYDRDTEIYHVIPSWRVADEGQVHAFLHADSVMKETKVKEDVSHATRSSTFIHSFIHSLLNRVKKRLFVYPPHHYSRTSTRQVNE